MSGRRIALIVANDRYDNEGLSSLRSPAADAGALRAVLGDPRVGGFDVEVAHNEAAHDLRVRIEDFFADRNRDDVLLLHFSCHGLKDESGELYFAAPNTRPNRLMATAVPADLVHKCMRTSRCGGVVLLLDCCYGGAFGRGAVPRAGGDAGVLEQFTGNGRGRAVITASSSVEYAFEGDRLADDQSPLPSVFTAALVEGLSSGAADRDEDGTVSVDELYDYLYERVRERSPRQTPNRTMDGHGDLWIARSNRRRIRPQPIPDELRAAIGNPDRYGRIGAVAELRSRLLSDNLPVAVGAAEALIGIEANDVREVAAAAREALTEALPRPAERKVHVTDRHLLRLGGPPLARTCRAETADDWITLDHDDDTVTISVAPGLEPRTGAVTLHGPAGAVEVTVSAGAQQQPTVAPLAVAGYEQLAVGGCALAMAAFGILLMLVPEPPMVQLIPLAYAMLWLANALLVQRTWASRLHAVVAVVVVGWLIAAPPRSFDYEDLRVSPLYGFWLVAGLLTAVTTFRGGHPAVFLERVTAGLTVVLGVLVIVLVDAAATFVGRFGYAAVAYGFLWTAVVVTELRRSPRGSPR